VILTGLMGEGVKLSKKARDFDSFKEEREKAVRNAAMFGQVRGQQWKSCPKQAHVRTGWMRKAGKLSEAERKSRKSSQKTAEQNVRLLP
jgi:hypothetical protein